MLETPDTNLEITCLVFFKIFSVIYFYQQLNQLDIYGHYLLITPSYILDRA